MKKITLIFIMLLAFAGISRAQIIEDYESLQMNLFSGNVTGSVSVVANPDPTGINTSLVVGKMLRSFKGDPWQGWYAMMPAPVDMTANKYVHVKVWKPRVSPTCFKLEGGAGNSGDVFPMTEAVANQWEEVVFDMSTIAAVSGEYVRIVLIPDFENPLTLTEDITLYFDDLYVNNDPAVGSPAVQMMENFEYIEQNIMLGGADDLSSFAFIANPDKSGGNASDHVIQLNRDKDGVPWCGFWGHPAVPVDVTTNKYVHARVWKPRISPVFFKLEGGPDGNLEIESMYPQTKINQWEDIVWDFSSMSGAYPIIAFMTDKADPVDLTEDIIIYFDDIIVSNDPMPRADTYQVLNIDMNGSPITAGQQVFFAGSFGGVYGTWNEPGSNMMNEMSDPDGDGIFTDTIYVNDGSYYVKCFIDPTWANGDNGPGDRTLMVNGGFNITYTWGVKAANITLNVDVHGAGLTPGQPLYFAGTFGGDYGTWNEPGTNMNNMLTDLDGDSIYSIALHLDSIGRYKFKFFAGPTWSGGEWNGGEDRTLMVSGDGSFDFLWGIVTGIKDNPFANKVSTYPVPFRNTLNINTLVDVRRVVITTSYGQQVARYDNLAAGRTSVNTSQLSSGMYFVTFYGKNGEQMTKKLIKN